jgi:hypothetical protein
VPSHSKYREQKQHATNQARIAPPKSLSPQFGLSLSMQGNGTCEESFLVIQGWLMLVLFWKQTLQFWRHVLSH